jgi:PleD family two-component response regulator
MRWPWIFLLGFLVVVLRCFMTPLIGKPCVLVVDDNYGNRLSLESLLESEYTVEMAISGHSALQLAGVRTYAVILLDVRMPVMDGFETAALLRRNPKVQDTAIIFTSAYDRSDAQVARGYRVGGTDYLFSPVDPDFLRLKMRTYVRMYLRIEALRSHVEQLTAILQSIQLEVPGCGPAEAALRAQVGELQELVSDMRREMAPA